MANQAGPGSQVANDGCMVSPAARGRGVARALAQHSFAEARAMGFAAMRFNFVVAANAVAVRLWQELGVMIVGRVSAAFRHPEQGLVDALAMRWRCTASSRLAP